MKANFKVKMEVTNEFLVEIYFMNDLNFFEKYFIWGNIQPSRDFLDTLYINFYASFQTVLLSFQISFLFDTKQSVRLLLFVAAVSYRKNKK